MASFAALTEPRSKALVEQVADACADTGTALVVTGPVGSGKSTLLDAIAGRVAKGTAVLWATAVQEERGTPFGVLGQLLDQAPLGPGRRAEIERVLHGPEPVSVREAAALCAPLLELTTAMPVLICVDDAHWADRETAQWLMFLVRRMGTARITVLLAERASWLHPGDSFHAALVHQPRCHPFVLEQLSEQSVADLVRRHSGTHAPAAAERYAALSGGNPLLVHALLEEQPTAEHRELGTGYPFLHAVLRCLHRSEEPVLTVARATAVLGDAHRPRLLAELADLPPAHVEAGLRGLESTGLLADGRFRHDAARSIVLSDTPPGDLARYQDRAARSRYLRGAPDREIADRLLATDPRCEAWRVETLRAAAGQAAAGGDCDRARQYLEHALHCTADTSRIRLQLAELDSRSEPGNGTRQLPALVTALDDQELSGRQTVDLVLHLVRHGRADTAGQVLRRLRDTPVGAGLRPLITGSFPGLLGELGPERTFAAHPGVPVWIRADPRLSAASALADVLRGQAGKHTVQGAEQILRSASPRHSSWEEIEFALLVLVYTDQVVRAEAHCERLSGVVDETAPGWRPPLSGLRALIALRRGQPAQAELFATAAVTGMAGRAWGACIGTPLAALFAAHAALGHRDGSVGGPPAHRVPTQLYLTRHGLHYLHARGEYRLATGNPSAALADFMLCGELMREWRIDQPGVVPWRGSAALAQLALGEREAAAALVAEQLGRLRPAATRTRAVTLRIAAEASDLKNRPALLRKAAALLQNGDDPAELTLTLHALSRAYQGLGDEQRSRASKNRADQQARLSGLALPAPEEPAGPAPAEAAGAAGLSEAENRVATLAALGYTNREISDQLIITVSTVEQHLTRVYRKLEVGRRADLVERLGLIARSA